MHCFRLQRFDQAGHEEIPATILAANAEIASAAAWLLRMDLAALPCERGVAFYGPAYWGIPERFYAAIGFDDAAHQGRTESARRRRRAAREACYTAWGRKHLAEIAAALESLQIGTTSRTERRALDELRDRMTADEFADFLATRDEECFESLHYRLAAEDKAARIRKKLAGGCRA